MKKNKKKLKTKRQDKTTPSFRYLFLHIEMSLYLSDSVVLVPLVSIQVVIVCCLKTIRKLK